MHARRCTFYMRIQKANYGAHFIERTDGLSPILQQFLECVAHRLFHICSVDSHLRPNIYIPHLQNERLRANKEISQKLHGGSVAIVKEMAVYT